MSHARRQGTNFAGRRDRGKGYNRCPVQLGEELEVDITELSPKGDGIAKVQGLVIYVPHTKPGNHIKIKITRIGLKAANAEIIAQ
jgi:predicted RNA-binding protein with TRAM domain